MTMHVSPTRREFLGFALRSGAALAGAVVVTHGGGIRADGELSAIGVAAAALDPAARIALDDTLTFPALAGDGLIVLDNFGGFSVSSGSCSHRGIDIFATDADTPRVLVACVDGIVSGQRFEATAGSQGNAWILQDAQGVSYRYHHIDEFEPGLEVGSQVRRGDVIATMGTSGNANFPHVHFEVRPDGTGASAIDPLPMFVFPIDGVEVGPPAGCS